MNETLNPPALLEAAARLVTRAIRQLDATEEAPCPTCHLRRFRNKEEARVYESLSALPSRLRNAAAKLQGRDWTVGEVEE